MQQKNRNSSSQLEIASELFKRFVKHSEKDKNNEKAIRKALRNYQTKNMKIENVTSLRALRMFQAIIEKYQSGIQARNSWLENQRRIFIWTLVCYIHREGLQINQLTFDHYQQLNSLFPRKQLALIKFQTQSLIKNGNRNQRWKIQEDQILETIIQKQLKLSTRIEWTLVSRQFFQQTQQKYFRNSKQCRERWLNHLDPNKTKGNWELLQDITILKQVLLRGKKWSKIASLFDGKKNQHMVKNRYKSLIHKMQKKVKRNSLRQSELISMLLAELQGQEISGNSENISARQKNQKKKSNRDQDLLELQEISNEQEESINNNLVNEVMEQQQNNKNNKIINNNKKNDKKDKQQQQTPRPSRKSPPSIISNLRTIESSLDKSLIDRKSQSLKNIHNIQQNEIEVQDRQKPLIQNQMEFRGPEGNELNNQMFERIVHNINTPGIENNRYSIMLGPKSPAFIMSPFQSRVWTPNIFFIEDRQDQVSPQLNFGSFCSKYTNDFDQFINQDQDQDQDQSNKQ